MPCGGIYPEPRIEGDNAECFACGKIGAKHFCEEWDCFIHARCALTWLDRSPEGAVVIKHKHKVVLDFSLEEKDAGN